MFLALRDISAARGRFALIAGVVGLITLLVVMLSGLTGGLGKQNTSALESLGPDRFALSSSEEGYSFTSSSVTDRDADEWASISGVSSVTPLGTAQGVMSTADTTTSVAILGLPAGTPLPVGGEVPETGAVASQELNVSAGDEVTLAGTDVNVVDTATDDYFAHSPVVWVSTDTWRSIAHAQPDVVGTALLLDGDLSSDSWKAAGDDTTALTMREAFNALPAYQSENGSLLMMQGFLYAISALVTVSFLTVWTIQRTRDLAVLRALGASPRYLLRDSLGQALIILLAGVGLGALAGAGLGALVTGTVPFQLDLTTTLLPAVGILALGLAGALLATRRVTKIDPLTALSTV